MRHFFFNSNINIYLQESKWRVREINTVRNVLKAMDIKNKGLTIKLSNDKNIKYCNSKWRGINKPTNVLSFSQSHKKFYLNY